MRSESRDLSRGPDETRDSRPATLHTRPSHICAQLLAALDASEGRRRRRKRNTTPDSIGMTIKRTILEDTVRDDPDPDAYEAWLLERCVTGDGPSGPTRAMALEVLSDWRLAHRSTEFRSWLSRGAPSDDAGSQAAAPEPEQ
jgi:hypothetical protein